jgi:hypothetical protein
MSKKQTAVEWLIEEIRNARKLCDDSSIEMDIFHTLDVLINKEDQAKEMFEQQTKEAWQHGFDWGMMEQSLAEQGHESTLIDANHYYKETYELS